MEVVYNLINVKKFFKYSYEEKLELKAKGRPLPDLTIEKTGVSRGKSYMRKFNRDIYLKNEWICGCNKTNALYCFPCLLFGGDKAWTERGVTDIEHLTMKIKRHENSKTHLYNCVEFALIGSSNITAQLDSAYWLNIQKHNENVSKNRYILTKIINCIKFCGAFELALRGHNESDTSENPGIFRGLINFSAELDATLSEHLNNASVFIGASKEIQNDLLQCMLEVCHEQIIAEIKNSPFMAIIADETTDVAAKSQMVVIFRYVRDGEPIERFWTYVNPEKCDAETLSNTLLNIIDPLIQNSPNKLIAQSYDGAAVMSDRLTGVQARIKEKFPYANFVHCYAHQLNLIMSKAASQNSQIRVFFGNLQEIPAFFINSPQSVEILHQLVKSRVPHGAPIQWNFNISNTVNMVYEHRESLIDCMETIEDTFYHQTVCSAASSIRRMLQDQDFIFWLTFFYRVMPHVDVLCNELQKRQTNPGEIDKKIEIFEQNVILIRNIKSEVVSETSDYELLPAKRIRISDSNLDHRVGALEACDVILNCVKDRLAFKNHLSVATLFHSEKFGEYCKSFPEEILNLTCSSYPNIDKERLKIELSVIYSRPDCKSIKGAVPFLKFLIENNLSVTFHETRNLLEILVTIPMTTAEAERTFSTLKRIKTFLRNSMTEDEDRLVALSMISIEKAMIREISNFNEKVIDKFAAKKDRGINLIYKK